jgi:hypothetical protein
MAKTLWVQANPTEANTRKVILSEADEAHPGTHEVWIVAYEDPRFDADGNPVKPANPPIEVGDTPGVRAALNAKDLIEVSAPAKASESARSAGLTPNEDAALARDYPMLSAAGFTSVEHVRRASDEELLAVEGVGPATLKRLRADLGQE